MGTDNGLLATRSSGRGGAAVVLLGLVDGRLEPRAEGPEIGLGNRWLNLFAARGGYAYAVRTPHIGGPLERYRLLQDDHLPVERYPLGVTNHVIGSRNLDLGVLLPPTSEGDLLVLPTNDRRALRLVACVSAGCSVVSEFPLRGRLSGNLTFVEHAGGVDLYAGDSDGGGVTRIPLAALAPP